jgi:hypothetical protein
MSSGKLLSMEYGGFGLNMTATQGQQLDLSTGFEKIPAIWQDLRITPLTQHYPRIVDNKPQLTVTQVWLAGGNEGT